MKGAAAAVREDKADVFYFGAMTQGTLGIAQEIAATLGMPVIDPIAVSSGGNRAGGFTLDVQAGERIRVT